jgi:hypothetical protein
MVSAFGHSSPFDLKVKRVDQSQNGATVPGIVNLFSAAADDEYRAIDEISIHQLEKPMHLRDLNTDKTEPRSATRPLEPAVRR